MKASTITLFTFFACLIVAFGTDQHQYDDLKAKLESAINAKDTKALSDCYYWEGTPQALIDQSIWCIEESWKNNQLKEVTFQQLNDPAMSPRFVTALIEGHIMNGRHYVPNLTPVAVCSIRFSKNGSTTGTANAVGMAPDGKLKIVGTKVIEK